MNSRRKRTYAVVIGLGLLALLIDRMVGSATPAPAHASVGSRRPRAASQPAPAVEHPVATVVPAPFPRIAARGLDPAEVRDVFAISVDVQRAMRTWATGGAGGPEDGPESSAVMDLAAFKANHRLSAVMGDGQTNMAIVDGRCLRKGDTFDSCTLDDISGRSAVFTCPGGSVELTIAAPQP